MDPPKLEVKEAEGEDLESGREEEEEEHWSGEAAPRGISSQAYWYPCLYLSFLPLTMHVYRIIQLC